MMPAKDNKNQGMDLYEDVIDEADEEESDDIDEELDDYVDQYLTSNMIYSEPPNAVDKWILKFINGER